MQLHPALLLQNLPHKRLHKRTQLVRERIPKHRVRHQSLAPKERVGPDTLGPVDNLVGDDEMSRGDFFPQ